jgi:hypothetical protein
MDAVTEGMILIERIRIDSIDSFKLIDVFRSILYAT